MIFSTLLTPNTYSKGTPQPSGQVKAVLPNTRFGAQTSSCFFWGKGTFHMLSKFRSFIVFLYVFPPKSNRLGVLWHLVLRQTSLQEWRGNGWWWSQTKRNKKEKTQIQFPLPNPKKWSIENISKGLERNKKEVGPRPLLFHLETSKSYWLPCETLGAVWLWISIEWSRHQPNQKARAGGNASHTKNHKTRS